MPITAADIDWTRPVNAIYAGGAAPFPGHTITDQIGEGDWYGRGILDFLETSVAHEGLDFVVVLRGLVDLGLTGRRAFYARTVAMLEYLPDVAAEFPTTECYGRRHDLMHRVYAEMARRALARDPDFPTAVDRWLATEPNPMSDHFWWHGKTSRAA